MKLRVFEYQKINGINLEKLREILFENVNPTMKLIELQEELKSKLNIVVEKQQIFYDGRDLTFSPENNQQTLFSLVCQAHDSFSNKDEEDQNHIHSLRLVVRDRILYRSTSNDQHSFPSVEQLLPNQGNISGGNRVIVKAINVLHSEHWIASFGTIYVPASRISDFELECIAPAHSVGNVAVEISHDGSHWTSNQSIYTYTDFTPNLHNVVVPVSAPSSINVNVNSAPCRPTVELKQPPRADQ